MYVLGDVLQDEGFKNAVIDAIVEVATKSNVYPTAFTSINSVYENTSKSAMLRKLMVDFWAFCYSTKWFEFEQCKGGDGPYPSEYLYEVLRVAVKETRHIEQG
jgi:hypothetical protein